jgi:hypothetical protein
MSESALSEQAGAVAAGYAFEGAALELGRLVEAAEPDAATAVDVKIPSRCWTRARPRHSRR